MGRHKKYLTEEEIKIKKEAKKKYLKEYRLKNKDKIKKIREKFYQKNKDKILEYQKKYYQDNKDIIISKQKEYGKEYYQDNKEIINKRNSENRKKRYHENKEKELEKKKKWRENNREKYNLYMEEYRKKYYKTPYGRAAYLVNTYNQSDRKYNRGKGDLTAQWVLENILFKPCAHCEKTDWTKIGCNRLDNSKPHTIDNVEPCCRSCNDKQALIQRERDEKGRLN